MADNFKACSIEGCGRNANWTAKGAKGYCQRHYHRMRTHGDPLGGRTPDGEPLQFIHVVALQHIGDDCLTWPYAKNRKGYGRVKVDGAWAGAHRYLCTLVHGEPPSPAHEAAHTCGRGKLGCVNPNHLEWKTRTENEADKLIHGTHGRGERCSLSKLTEEQVGEILALKGIESQHALADRFGVSRSAICAIQRGRRWSWLTNEARAALSLPENAEDRKDKK